VDQRRLQLYERSKLRYFYAVAEFGSAAAAAHVYAECDGLEFERSANKLDLRFVPDGQSFEGREPRDVATTVLPAVACCMSACGNLMFDLFALDGICLRVRPVSQAAALQGIQVKRTRVSQAKLASCSRALTRGPNAASACPAAGAGAPGLCAAAGVRDRGAAAHAREADVGRGRRGAQAHARAPPDAGRAARGRLPGAPCALALAMALASAPGHKAAGS